MNHTPGPWKAFTHKDSWHIHGPDCLIANMRFETGLLEETYERQRQDAKRIVHCVNTHDALLEVLKELHAAVQNYRETGKPDFGRLTIACDKAEDTIDKAEKGA